MNKNNKGNKKCKEDKKRDIKIDPELVFLTGLMTSAKSASLQIQAFNLREKGAYVIVMTPETDNRNSHGVVKSRIEALKPIEALTIKKRDNIFKKIKSWSIKPDIIFVDEVNFLTAAQVNQLCLIVDELGIPVHCYGLMADFRSKFFPGSARLLPLCDRIVEFRVHCDCGKVARINARLDESGNVTNRGNQTHIGYNYRPMCRKCYRKSLLSQVTKK